MFNGSWVAAQDASITCGFHCDSNVREGADVYYCAPDYRTFCTVSPLCVAALWFCDQVL